MLCEDGEYAPGDHRQMVRPHGSPPRNFSTFDSGRWRLQDSSNVEKGIWVSFPLCSWKRVVRLTEQDSGGHRS